MAWHGFPPSPLLRPPALSALARQGGREQGRKEARDEETKFPGHEGEDKGNDIRGVTDGSCPTQHRDPGLAGGEFGRGRGGV